MSYQSALAFATSLQHAKPPMRVASYADPDCPLAILWSDRVACAELAHLKLHELIFGNGDLDLDQIAMQARILVGYIHEANRYTG